MARLLVSALSRFGDVDLKSRYVTRARSGAPDTLERVRHGALEEAERLISDAQAGIWSADAWLTYHLYYKAPDWIGARVAGALGIPYFVVEASYAGKRDHGAWAVWQADAVAQLRQADRVFSVSPLDTEGLARVVDRERIVDLPPFVDTASYRAAGQSGPRRDPSAPLQIVSVAMMREDVKRESYRLAADALSLIAERNWHWHIVGDGPACGEIRAAAAGIKPEQITWHGALQSDGVRAVLARGDVFFWPGLKEGFGIVYLEAQAMGLAVVALDQAGVPAVVRDGETGILVKADGEAERAVRLADALSGLLDNRPRLAGLQRRAAAFVHGTRTIDGAALTLQTVIADTISRRGCKTGLQ